MHPQLPDQCSVAQAEADQSDAVPPGRPPWGRARWRAWWPRLLAVVAALLVLTVAAVAGIGWYFSGVAIAVGNHQPDLDATVRAVHLGGAVRPGEAEVQLTGTDTELPGQYGLEWSGGYGQVGQVTAVSGGVVTRSYTPQLSTPVAGAAVGLDPDYWTGDPQSALGLPFQEVTVRSDVGALPTWYVPAAAPSGGSWVVFVHGHDSSRRESLRYLAFLHGRGLPVLVPTYRNDVGAPPSPDRVDHLGDTEWRDVEAAVRWALDHGAHDVVLFGWSMGAAVSLQLVDRSPVRDAVRGLVLDSPVLDWRDVLNHQGDQRNLPRPVSAVAEWLIGLRLGTDLGRFDWVARARSLTRPMLVLHSTADAYVPHGPSLALRRARPDLVSYQEIPGAKHTRGWNVDPWHYQAVVGDWLAQHGL